MSARGVLTRVIAGIPDLLSCIVTQRFIRDTATHVHVRTAGEVADRIAAVLPALLAAEGYELVELPGICPDGYGGWSVRVPLTGQPWADGEVRIDDAGRVALAGVPLRLEVVDVPAVAAALLAVHTAVMRGCYRPPRAQRGSTL
ncbi:hypothetical protein [Mycobacteroides immunogenum]|uniref:hypothetical protein n=1 Tax=Mycobacteroides immunogenum TaxID=83262 RepID=UPI001F32F449|nr:hypothetical protein [Mycobacteroides immunogenum]